MSSRAIQATLSPNTSACSSPSSLSASWAAVILALSAIAVFSLRRSLEQTDDHEPRGGRGHIRPRGLATPHSATRPLLKGSLVSLVLAARPAVPWHPW